VRAQQQHLNGSEPYLIDNFFLLFLKDDITNKEMICKSAGCGKQ
jgi:hypothetical protein